MQRCAGMVWAWRNADGRCLQVAVLCAVHVDGSVVVRAGNDVGAGVRVQERVVDGLPLVRARCVVALVVQHVRLASVCSDPAQWWSECAGVGPWCSGEGGFSVTSQSKRFEICIHCATFSNNTFVVAPYLHRDPS